MRGRPHGWGILALLIPMGSGCWVTKYEWCGWDSADSGSAPSVMDNGGIENCRGNNPSLDAVIQIFVGDPPSRKVHQENPAAANKPAACGLTKDGDSHCLESDGNDPGGSPASTVHQEIPYGYTGCKLTGGSASGLTPNEDAWYQCLLQS